jgi:predicted transcriptional regulator YdeE
MRVVTPILLLGLVSAVHAAERSHAMPDPLEKVAGRDETGVAQKEWLERKWKPKVVQCEAMAVLGVRQRFSFSKGPHPKTLWEGEFMKQHAQIKPLSANGDYWGLIAPTADPDIADYTAGMSVGSITHVPAGLVLVRIPAGQFLELEFDFRDIGDSGLYALETWLPSSKYELNPDVPAREMVSVGKTPTRLRVPIRDRSPRGEVNVPAPADLRQGAR